MSTRTKIFAGMSLLVVFSAAGFPGNALAPASAETKKVDCESVLSDSRCTWLKSGNGPLESYVPKGWQAIRLIGGAGLRENLNFMAEFLRKPDGEIVLSVHDFQEPEHRIAQTIDESTWSDVTDSVIRLKANYGLTARVAAAVRGEHVVACADGRGIEIDTTLGGTIGHFEGEDCTYPELDAYLDAMRSKIYALIPYCKGLAKDVQFLCPVLDGDRFAAASFVNQLFLLGHCESGALPKKARASLNDDLSVSVAGKSVVHGPEAVSAVTDFYCRAKYDFRARSILARAGSVKVEGEAWTYRDLPLGNDEFRTHDYTAPFSQLWKRGHGGRYRMTDWDVGAFVESQRP